MGCERGDLTGYAALRRQLSDREGDQARQRAAARRREALASLERLRRGDIIQVPSGRRAGIAVVLEPTAADGQPMPLVLTASRQVRRLSPADFPVPVTAIERIRIPVSFSVRSANHRRDLAATVRNKLAGQALPRPRRNADGAGGTDDAEIARLRRELREHPCHQCPDREAHLRQAERYIRLRARGRGAGAPGGQPVARAGPDLRPGLRGAGGAGLRGRGQGDPEGQRLAACTPSWTWSPPSACAAPPGPA